MSYKDVTPGTKVGRAKAARFIESKSGTLGMEIAFDFYEPNTGGTESLNWVGWLTPAAIEFTMDTLVSVLGYNGDDSCNEDGTLANKDALNWGKDVNLVVELREYEGKMYPQIRYVNRVGGSAFDGCKSETVKSKLGAVGFKNAFLAASQAKAALVTKDVPF